MTTNVDCHFQIPQKCHFEEWNKRGKPFAKIKTNKNTDEKKVYGLAAQTPNKRTIYGQEEKIEAEKCWQ